MILGADGGSPWPVGAWLEQRRRNPASLNLALLVGHATVREQVLHKEQCENPRSVERALADVGGASRVTITEFPPNRSHEMRTLEDLARTAGIAPVDMYIRVIREGDAGIGGLHPRGAGTFPRVLGLYVREKQWLTLPEAIRKMTSLPAQRLGWTDRGTIREGAFADLVPFDPDTVIDRATLAQPAALPSASRRSW